MKVLVLSCSTGGGHNACGNYIVKEFANHDIVCDLVDYFSILGDKSSLRAEKLYLDSTKGNGKVFKSVYKLGELYSKTGITSPVYALNKLIREKINKYIQDNNYDLVISTHLFPAMAITALRVEGKNIKLINVATDYTCIPFWEETKPDYFVIPHDSLKQEFISKGFNQEVLLPIGIPISEDFQNNLKKIDFQTDKKVVLITSGSMGFGKMKDIVKSLLKALDNIYLVVICGNNHNLYDELTSLNNSNLLVKGFVNNMNDYINSCDVVLTKPGGLTSTEVAVLNKPMVHIMPIPGVENYNSNFFASHGLSLVSNSIDEIISNTKKILEDNDLQKEMINNQKNVINKHSASDLVDFILKNVEVQGIK